MFVDRTILQSENWIGFTPGRVYPQRSFQSETNAFHRMLPMMRQWHWAAEHAHQSPRDLGKIQASGNTVVSILFQRSSSHSSFGFQAESTSATKKKSNSSASTSSVFTWIGLATLSCGDNGD
jgi:hypothetical protein